MRAGRNPVAGERRARPHSGSTGDGAGGRIVQRPRVGGEIAGPPGCQGQRVVLLILFAVAVPLPVRHEEHLVGPNRTAKRVAVLVPLERGLRQRRLCGRERVGPRVEGIVAVELEHGSVELVRAGLGDDVHLAGGAAELGRVDAGLHLELFERVDRRQQNVRIEIDVGVVRAVECVVVVLAALP